MALLVALLALFSLLLAGCSGGFRAGDDDDDNDDSDPDGGVTFEDDDDEDDNDAPGPGLALVVGALALTGVLVRRRMK